MDIALLNEVSEDFAAYLREATGCDLTAGDGVDLVDGRLKPGRTTPRQAAGCRRPALHYRRTRRITDEHVESPEPLQDGPAGPLVIGPLLD